MDITKRLKDKNMSQRELAKKVGVTEVTMGRYIKGDRQPNGTTLYKIANALGCTVEELLGEKKNDDVELSYMDCWHYVAPLLPLSTDPLAIKAYVMIFQALKEAEKREKK